MKSSKTFWYWGLLFGLYFLAFALLRFYVGFNGLYGQDSHEYLRATKYFAEHLSFDQFLWPVGYPLVSALLIPLLGSPTISLQVVSALSFLGSLMLLFRCLQVFTKKTESISWYLALFALLSPYLLRASFFSMSDMLAVLAICVTLFQSLSYHSIRKSKFLLVAFGAASIAVITRYQAAVIVGPLLAILTIQELGRKRVVSILSGSILFLLPVVANFYLKGFNHAGISNHYGLQLWSVANYFKSEFNGPDGYLSFTLPNLLFAVTNPINLGYLSIGVPLLFFSKKKDVNYKSILGLFIVFINALFVAGAPFQNTRHFLLIYPLVLLLFFPLFQRLYLFLSSKKLTTVVFLGLFVCQLALCARALYTPVKNGLMQQEIARFIHRDFPGASIYSSGISMCFDSYNLKNKSYSTFDTLYPKFEPKALYLINLDWQAAAHAQLPPQQNWNTLNAKYELKLVQQFDMGWEAYLIQSKRTATSVAGGQ